MGVCVLVVGFVDQVLFFVAVVYFWIVIHGVFLFFVVRLLWVDVHIVVIASVANIGGAVSVPVVVVYYDEWLVLVSILMVLIGYAVGNYAVFGVVWFCRMVVGV